MKACIAALALAACGGGSASCLLDDVIASEQGGAPVMDCGHLAVGASGSAMTAAHDCALAAANAHQPFALEWQLMGVDSHVARAYLGVVRGGAWTVLAFRYDGSPGGSGADNDPHTNTTTCASLADLGDCGGDRPQSLCVSCAGEAAFAQCP